MKKFIEQDRIQFLIERSSALAKQTDGIIEFKLLSTITAKDKEFPLYGIRIGSTDRSKPTLGLFGGVHGLEVIGTQTVLAYFESLFEQMSWDELLVESLKNVRIVSIPMVNPAGVFFGTRSNANGVDLMRNAPVEALSNPAFLLGGHRISPRLPWYRGNVESAMEIEAEVLCEFVKQEIFGAEAAMVLDVHSGFGLQDRLWYPYAKSIEPFPDLDRVTKLKNLLDRSYPNHVYVVEAQSLNYTTHGDLWDYLFDEHKALYGEKAPLFIPWTLEMGSWNWIRKNPLQLFSSMGAFNPIKRHRFKRIMRRHLPLFDFFLRATRNWRSWV